jgi:hypothetical protein
VRGGGGALSPTSDRWGQSVHPCSAGAEPNQVLRRRSAHRILLLTVPHLEQQRALPALLVKLLGHSVPRPPNLDCRAQGSTPMRHVTAGLWVHASKRLT